MNEENNVSIETVSRWLSHLQQLGYIHIKIDRNKNKEIIARYIYIIDISCKNQYPIDKNVNTPYCQKNQYTIDEKVKDNNININIDDDLFYLVINRSFKIENNFYEILQDLDLLYTEDVLKIIQQDKILMLKNIILVLYELYNSQFNYILTKVTRESLLNLYNISLEHNPNDFFNYYKRAIINKYTNAPVYIDTFLGPPVLTNQELGGEAIC